MSTSPFVRIVTPLNVKSAYGQRRTAPAGYGSCRSRIFKRALRARHAPAEPPKKTVVAGSAPRRSTAVSVDDVVERRGELMHGRQAILDAEGVAIRSRSLRGSKTAGLLDASGHESAAVKVQNRSRWGSLRAVPLGADTAELDILDGERGAHIATERRFRTAISRRHDADTRRTRRRARRGPRRETPHSKSMSAAWGHGSVCERGHRPRQ